MLRIVLGLGGNVGDVGASFARAVAALREGLGEVSVSSAWRSRAVGPEQPEFTNAALLLVTDVRPSALLVRCQDLEAAAGRDRARGAHWGPRPLDLDLLIAEDLVLESPALTIPHPHFHRRRFALLPAAELVPDWIHPRRHRSLADLAAALDPASQPCERLVGWRLEA